MVSMATEIMLLREAAVLIAAAAGAYTDWKTGYIYDWITLPLIAIGAIAAIISQQYSALALGAIVFAAGYLFYYMGKLGGGDVKLYTGIALMIPELNGGIYIASAAVYSSLCAIIFLSVYFVLKYARKGIDLKYNSEGIMKAGFAAVFLAAYVWIISGTGIVSPAFVLVLSVPMAFGCVFLGLEKGIRKEFFLKKIRVNEIEDDEVAALDFMEPEEKQKLLGTGLGLKGIIGENEKAALEKKRIKEVLVYRDLPRLGPFIFLGCIIAMAGPGITSLIMA